MLASFFTFTILSYCLCCTISLFVHALDFMRNLIQVFDLLLAENSYASTLAANATRFRQGMAANGFNVLGHSTHPIAPVFLGDAK